MYHLTVHNIILQETECKIHAVMLIIVLVLKDRFQVFVLVLASQSLLFQFIVFYLLSIHIIIIHFTINSTIY